MTFSSVTSPWSVLSRACVTRSCSGCRESAVTECPSASALQRILYETFLRSLAADKAVADAEVSRSALQWTIVAPVTFAVGSRVGRYRVGEEIRVSGLPRISRASVADFMLKCLQDPSTIGKRLAMVPE